MSILIQNFFEFDHVDDYDEEDVVVLGLGILSSANKHKRIRIHNYVEETIPRYLDDDFKAHFRMKRSTVEVLISSIGPHIIRQPGRPSLPIEKQVLVTIWYLSNQEVFRSIADRFNVSKSTAYEVVNRILDMIILIRGQWISWPTEAEARQTSAYFNLKNGFPDIIGSIDGSHIPLSRPKDKGDSYVNRKGFHSIILQGICNEKQEFIDVSCGWPGSMHDARVLRNSDFGQRLLQNADDLFYGRFHLLADSAYPLSKYILTPYRDNGHLSARQKKFNRILSSNRILIEHSFGILDFRY